MMTSRDYSKTNELSRLRAEYKSTTQSHNNSDGMAKANTIYTLKSVTPSTVESFVVGRFFSPAFASIDYDFSGESFDFVICSHPWPTDFFLL